MFGHLRVVDKVKIDPNFDQREWGDEIVKFCCRFNVQNLNANDLLDVIFAFGRVNRNFGHCVLCFRQVWKLLQNFD